MEVGEVVVAVTTEVTDDYTTNSSSEFLSISTEYEYEEDYYWQPWVGNWIGGVTKLITGLFAEVTPNEWETSGGEAILRFASYPDDETKLGDFAVKVGSYTIDSIPYGSNAIGAVVGDSAYPVYAW